MNSGLRIEISGVVQGVGFRPWVYRIAHEMGIAGRVRNDAAGVTIDAFASEEKLDSFLAALKQSWPPAADVRGVTSHSIPPEDVDGFTIVASAESSERAVSIPADMATCDECAAEIFDSSNRRYRYPFTNCTNCGPRFTIALDIPYDRPATTMAPFAMCDECRAEYENPLDRRFHAQPNACPVCGPQLELLPRDCSPGEGDAIQQVANAIREGKIVAIKGIGGFHLACDATSDTAVSLLRARKRRDEKPFAVMVRDLTAAREVAELTADDERLLLSIERPVVLVRRRSDSPVNETISPLVAPKNRLVGLLLPYSPLHHLLLHDIDRPIVLTSANLSDEPIAFRNEEAIERLGTIADLFVLHNRDIVTRCDDSVVRNISASPVLMRRSRGYVPRPVIIGREFDRPVLACGAHLKNTFAVAERNRIYLGPHIGDLENVSTLESFEESIDRMLRFVGVTPEVIAFDMHPAYLSTQYAKRLSQPVKIAVQHHHAHIAAVMAEHDVTDEVIGVAYDGTGYGTDATAWGGEVLLTRYDSFERLATFRPIVLAGADSAIRQVWRIALALLEDAYDGAPPLGRLPLFRNMANERTSFVRSMLQKNVQTINAHGVGRYFDAFGAAFLSREEARYEGQVALEWNLVADEAFDEAYPFAINFDLSPFQIDLRPSIRAALDEFSRGAPIAILSARFHSTIADATAAVVREAVRKSGVKRVALGGGCFQNDLLTTRIIERLSPFTTVLRNRNVPPGDGGIALGQAVIADAVARNHSTTLKEDACASAYQEES